MCTRKNCVICDSVIIPFSRFKHPVYDCISIGQQNNTWDIEYGYCNQCFSVQLTKLADPLVLYDKNYTQPLHYTYLWIQHNISFIKFIIDHYNSDIHSSILEIGSSSFCLGKHLFHYYKDYTVFDYSLEQAVKIDNVHYIEGNCEVYPFQTETIVLSHVFEHLYEPKLFLQNCLQHHVKNIFIAVPSMNKLDSFHIGNQHTFSYNEHDIEYIFGLFQYKLVRLIKWDSVDTSFPCLFCYFTLTDKVIPIERPIFQRHLFSIDFLTNNIVVPKRTFLATCGMFSVISYSRIQNKEDVVGVIDINPTKHGKLFSCTELLVYPYEHLQEGDSILVIHPKKDNIIRMVQSMHKNIHILQINNDSP
jgi:hypothetical protein